MVTGFYLYKNQNPNRRKQNRYSMKTGLHSLRKCLCTLAIALAFYNPSYSQLSAGNYFEAGATVGPMVFLGDLGGHYGIGTTFLKDYNMNATKLAFGFYVAAHPSEIIGFRLSANFGSVEGDDNYITNKGGLEEARLNRNLDFKSTITEANFMVELYPTVLFEDQPTEQTGRLRPYGVIGVGVFHFNPMGQYVDPNTSQTTWVYLQPLHTEGEGFVANRPNYALTQLNIPMGFGLKYYISEKVNVGLEFLYRKSFTDYIDDVSTTFVDPAVLQANLPNGTSQIAIAMSNKSPLMGIPGSDYNPGDKRGDPTQDDAYFTIGLKIGIRLGSDHSYDNSTRCPLLRF
jgi:hypothetical protein